MTFWKALRWAGSLFFVLMVLVSWLGTDRNGNRSDQQTRHAPIIVR
jgi:hypothetical protein